MVILVIPNKGYTDYKNFYFSKNENRPVNENPDSKIAIVKNL